MNNQINHKKFNSPPESQEELEGGDDVGFEAGSGDGGREGGAGNDDDGDDDDDEMMSTITYPL